MTITLDLAPDMETYLRAKAAREGQAAEAVAQALFAQAIQSDLQSQQGVLLKEYGVNPAQAAEIRDSLASFADEWDQSQMDVYNDYESAKARLDAELGAKP